MRLPRPRLKIWMLLVLVAIVALGIGGQQMRRRRARYLQVAAEHAKEEGTVRQEVREMDEVLKLFVQEDSELSSEFKKLFQKEKSYAQKWLAYHVEMRRRFEDAAAYPWRGYPEAIPKPANPEELLEETEDPPVRYEAEEGIPPDGPAKTRRDFAVLEAALNDLTSPKNPEYINWEPGREIVVHDEIMNLDRRLFEIDFPIVPEAELSIEAEHLRSIPADIKEDFKRRCNEHSVSLADFKPANPNIIVDDIEDWIDEMVEPMKSLDQVFRKHHPTAWGFVEPILPAYSKDGKKAFVIFGGGRDGDHGLYWFYMLAREGKRWKVQWRHCQFR